MAGAVAKSRCRINLWEAISHLTQCKDRPASSREQAGEIQAALGDASSMAGQELSLEATEDGWVIEVHSCYESGKVRLLVPKDRGAKVRVLEDTRWWSGREARENV